MSQHPRSLLFIVACTLCSLANGLGLSAGAIGAEGDVVAVYLRDGRVLSGIVDQKTDDYELWLHSAEPSILVWTSTPWNQVRAGRVAGKPLTAEAFRIEAAQSKTPFPMATFRQETILALPIIPMQRRVQSLDLLANVTNWDRDAETDGLELQLRPLTSNGSALAVDGMLTVRLLGHRCGTRNSRTSPPRFGFWTDGTPSTEYSPLHASERYMEIGRWTERLKASRFSLDGYLVRLPFRSLHPEYDLDIGLDGLVECRLSVNGQGTFDAASPIQLRPYFPLRDSLQLDRGTRFFPDESRTR